MNEATGDALVELVKTVAENQLKQDNAILDLIKTLTASVLELTNVVEKQGDRIRRLEAEVGMNTLRH